MNSKIIKIYCFIFITLQSIGMISYFIWPFVGDLGQFLAGATIIFLFPGLFVGGEFVESIFSIHTNPSVIATLKVPVIILVNVFFWIGIPSIFIKLKKLVFK